LFATIKKTLNKQWHIAGSSEAGPQKTINEDVVFLDPHNNFAIVCDGVGGYGNGDLAAKMATEFLATLLQKHDATALDKNQCKLMLRQCHAHLLAHMQTHPNTKHMATTVVMAIRQHNKAMITWVGDSRAYLLRNNALNPVSHDHSFVNEKVDQGILTKEEAEAHPMANLITSSLGATKQSLKHIGIEIIRLKKHDKIILCTDGVYGYISQQELLAASKDNNDSATALTNVAISNNTADNCSAVTININ
jgi:serine/threonine protein phosphatase PrpC